MSTPINSQIVEDGLGELLSQFGDSANMRAILAAFLRPLQELENDSVAILEQMPLDVAAGVNLDVWGEIAGVARDGRTDDVYRALIKVTITAQRASGTVNAILDLVSELSGGGAVDYTPQYPAKFRLTITPPAPLTAQQIADILAALEAVVAAGVGYIVAEAAPDPFTYDIGPGYDVGKYATYIGP